MEDMLGRFQGDLGAIGADIRQLQEQSAAMSVRLQEPAGRRAAPGVLPGLAGAAARAHHHHRPRASPSMSCPNTEQSIPMLDTTPQCRSGVGMCIHRDRESFRRVGLHANVLNGMMLCAHRQIRSVAPDILSWQ